MTIYEKELYKELYNKLAEYIRRYAEYLYYHEQTEYMVNRREYIKRYKPDAEESNTVLQDAIEQFRYSNENEKGFGAVCDKIIDAAVTDAAKEARWRADAMLRINDISVPKYLTE